MRKHILRRAADGLAFGSVGCYFTSMSGKIGRVMRLALALTFIVSLVPHGIRAANADVKMVMAAATDMPMKGKCNSCVHDQKVMTAAACSGYCGSFVALPVIGPLVELSSVETARDFSGPTLAERTIPPDPYPPRPAVLN